jgi:hypothetical protein
MSQPVEYIRLRIGQVENRGSILTRICLLPRLLFSEYPISLPEGEVAGAEGSHLPPFSAHINN